MLRGLAIAGVVVSAGAVSGDFDEEDALMSVYDAADEEAEEGKPVH